jgi:hypothetical protein
MRSHLFGTLIVVVVLSGASVLVAALSGRRPATEVARSSPPPPMASRAASASRALDSCGDGERRASPCKPKAKDRVVVAGRRSTTRPFPPSSSLHQASAEEVQSALEAFRTSEVHVQWLGRIEALMGQKLSQGDRMELASRHLALLHGHSDFTARYLSGKIGREEYENLMNDLFVWNQDFYKEFLSDEEYQLVFELGKSATDGVIADTLAPGDELDLIHPETSVEEVRQKVPEEKLQALISIRKQNLLALKEIDERLAGGAIDEVEARQAADAAFKEYANLINGILSEEESKVIFGETRLSS